MGYFFIFLVLVFLFLVGRFTQWIFRTVKNAPETLRHKKNAREKRFDDRMKKAMVDALKEKPIQQTIIEEKHVHLHK